MAIDEKIFLDEQGAKVTSARVIIGSQTFAMSGITSVEVRKKAQKSRFLLCTFLFLSGLTLSIGYPVAGFSVAVLAIGILLAANARRAKYNLYIRAAGGEVNALESDSKSVLEIIASAITDAIVYRG